MLKYVALLLLIALAKADKLPGTFFPNSDFDPGFNVVTNVEARDGSIDTYDAPQAPVISQQWDNSQSAPSFPGMNRNFDIAKIEQIL